MAELDTEARFAGLEREISELRQQVMDLLAERRSYDELRSDVRRVQRTVTEFSEREQAHERYVQARFGVVEHDLRGINEDIQALQVGQGELREEMRAGMGDLRHGQQEIAAGQQQILEFLLGKTKQND